MFVVVVEFIVNCGVGRRVDRCAVEALLATAVHKLPPQRRDSMDHGRSPRKMRTRRSFVKDDSKPDNVVNSIENSLELDGDSNDESRGQGQCGHSTLQGHKVHAAIDNLYT
jgi:hypothetical protein